MIYAGMKGEGSFPPGRSVSAQTECSTAHPAPLQGKALRCYLSLKDFPAIQRSLNPECVLLLIIWCLIISPYNCTGIMRPLVSYNRKSRHSVSFNIIIAIAFFGHLHKCG